MGKLQQETGMLNEADELREMIADAENKVASLSAANARELMTLTTKAHRLISQLAEAGSDVRPEASRLDTVQQRILKQARLIVDGVGGEQAFVALRTQLNPGAHEDWWQLDAVLAAQRARRLKQVAAVAASVALVIALGFAFRNVLFPPDPVGDAVNAAQRALQSGDPAAAQSALELGLTQFPTDSTLLLWQASVLELRNDPRAAGEIGRAHV